MLSRKCPFCSTWTRWAHTVSIHIFSLVVHKLMEDKLFLVITLVNAIASASEMSGYFVVITLLVCWLWHPSHHLIIYQCLTEIARQIAIVFVSGATFQVTCIRGCEWSISLALGVVSILTSAVVCLFPSKLFQQLFIKLHCKTICQLVQRLQAVILLCC